MGEMGELMHKPKVLVSEVLVFLTLSASVVLLRPLLLV
jgi:hypothetical protein